MTTENDSCCGPAATSSGAESGRSERRGLWAAGASLVAAVVASACCWLPLLLVGFGVSAVGVSAAFETVRPLLLGVCAVLLGLGFYLVYFRKDVCAPGSECVAPNPKLKRFNQTMLWIATAGVLAFTFFPSYAGSLVAGETSAVMEAKRAGLEEMSLDIEGMTCEGCATNVEKALNEVPGVRAASVVYEDGKARVFVEPPSPPSHNALVEAVERAGYKASVGRGGKEK